MKNPGERTQLISEMRRIGPACWDAARHLGLDVVLVPTLPVGATHALNLARGLLVCLEGSEWSVWAGVAQCISADLGLNSSHCTVMDAAAVMCRRSGIIFHKRFA